MAQTDAGNLDAAGSETRAVGRRIADVDTSDLEAENLPARDVLGIAKHVVIRVSLRPRAICRSRTATPTNSHPVTPAVPRQ